MDIMDRTSEYQKMSNEGLVDLLLNRYHKKLRYDVLTITPLFERVVNVHGNSHNTLAAAKNLFDKVVAHLQFHITKEEQMLFPALVQLSDLSQCKALKGPIYCMRSDHQHDDEDLKQLKILMDDFVPPLGACQSYQKLMVLLREFVEDTFEHMKIENEILFPRFEVEE